MHMPFKSQIFRGSQGNLRSDQSFYDRIICRFRNMATWSATPLSSKVFRKKSATSCLTPIAANTIANCSSESSPREPALRSVPQAGHAGVRFLRKSEASVHGSVWSVRRWRRYRCGYSSGGIPADRVQRKTVDIPFQV